MLHSNSSPLPPTQTKFSCQKKKEKKNNTSLSPRKYVWKATLNFSSVPTMVSWAQGDMRAVCWVSRVLLLFYRVLSQKCISSSKSLTNDQGAECRPWLSSQWIMLITLFFPCIILPCDGFKCSGYINDWLHTYLPGFLLYLFFLCWWKKLFKTSWAGLLYIC